MIKWVKVKMLRTSCRYPLENRGEKDEFSRGSTSLRSRQSRAGCTSQVRNNRWVSLCKMHLSSARCYAELICINYYTLAGSRLRRRPATTNSIAQTKGAAPRSYEILKTKRLRVYGKTTRSLYHNAGALMSCYAVLFAYYVWFTWIWRITLTEQLGAP